MDCDDGSDEFKCSKTKNWCLSKSLFFELCFLNYSTIKFQTFFIIGCKVSGWKVRLKENSSITETIISNDIGVSECKSNCYEDKDCRAFEAHCLEDPVSIFASTV